MGTLTLSAERQGARMSKITNDNPFWHMMLYSCTRMGTVVAKGLIVRVVRGTDSGSTYGTDG